jgi:hypothetical protein
MKTSLRLVVPLSCLLILAPCSHATGDAPTTESTRVKRIEIVKDEPGEKRVERRFMFHTAGPQEMENVTFLGVETTPVDPALAAQLNLTKGTGLAVRLVLPDSPAAGVLQPHDVLLRLDDQILINTPQLAVLVRSFKPGAEVTLAFLRGGKEQTARVTLGEHDVPKDRWFGFAPGMEWHSVPSGGVPPRDPEQVLKMMELGMDGPARPIIVRRIDGPRRVEVELRTDEGTLEFKDERGSLRLVNETGGKQLTVKDPAGQLIFEGPVETPEQRAALPEDIRERLERIEQLRGFQFHPDEAFEPGEPLPAKSVSNHRAAEREGLRRLDTL